MTVRALLISPATSAALRAARFDDDCPLDERGLARARAAAGAVPRASRQLTAPSLRCRGTAAALGLSPEPAPALADLAVGRWRGRSLDELAAAEPEAVAAWLADPGAAPHGGESVVALVERVGTWLDGLGGESGEEDGSGDGRVLAVAEPAVIRAAVVHALALPSQAFWRLDVRPLTLTALSGRAGRWNLRCGKALGSTG
ncbi:histidine phosphatase family protein [Streptomyces sp. NPDC037389]|uniref:histidine phosphatase family protein n=1 Tax=Streptomyces sp. NPDC037389 TaxID=3155369 RepID=UPI0033DE1083